MSLCLGVVLNLRYIPENRRHNPATATIPAALLVCCFNKHDHHAVVHDTDNTHLCGILLHTEVLQVLIQVRNHNEVFAISFVQGLK